MAGEEDVKSYQRRTKSGRVITVEAYQRTAEGATEEALAIPGRPPMAAKPGALAGGRALPNIWIKPPKLPPPPPDPSTLPPSPAAQKAAQKLTKLFAGQKDAAPLLAALKALQAPQKPTAETKAKTNVTDKTAAVVKASQALHTATTIALADDQADSPDQTEEATTQMRALIEALGGPEQAINRGITPDVVGPVLPQADLFGKPAAAPDRAGDTQPDEPEPGPEDESQDEPEDPRALPRLSD